MDTILDWHHCSDYLVLVTQNVQSSEFSILFISNRTILEISWNIKRFSFHACVISFLKNK